MGGAPAKIDLPQPLHVQRAVQPRAAGDKAGVDQHLLTFLFSASEKGLIFLKIIDQRAPQIDGAGQAVAVVGGFHDGDLGIDRFHLLHDRFITRCVGGSGLVGNVLKPVILEVVFFRERLDQPDDFGDVFFPGFGKIPIFCEVDHQFRAAPVVAVTPVQEVGGFEILEAVLPKYIDKLKQSI